MRPVLPRIELEKKIYERLKHIDRDVKTLVRTQYSVMSMLVPTARPIKREMEIFKQRRKEKFVPLESVEKRLKYGK